MDRQIDAPGHGKDVGDGLNAKDKVYLRKAMITADKPTKQTVLIIINLRWILQL